MNEKDVRFSLYRFITRRAAELRPADNDYINPRILAGVSELPQVRPLWVVDAIPTPGSERHGRMYTMIDRRFNIMILTSGGPAGVLQAEEWISHVEKKIVNNNWRIPGVLFDFKYPDPKVFEDIGQGNLGVDTYYVAVSGLSFMDETEETLISNVQTITTTQASGRIDVVIPRFPRAFNFFKKYNVYAGTVSNDLKKTADSPIDAASPTSTKKTIDDMPGGVAPALVNSQIRYRIIEVIPESFNASVQPEPSGEAGNWMGLITLTVRAAMDLEIEQHYPLASFTPTYNIS